MSNASGLCAYRNSLGVPGKGVHFHVAGLAMMDVIGTIGIALVISLIIPEWHFGVVLGIAFLLGIILHRLFCVNTTIGKLIFGKI
jgi:hypothetical protein